MVPSNGIEPAPKHGDGDRRQADRRRADRGDGNRGVGNSGDGNRRVGDRGEGERAHLLGVVVNTLLAVMKILGGLLSSSPSLLADGYHSLADTATNTVAWFSFRWASRPPDEDHHYGHGKAEAAAGFFVGLILILVGLGILWEALRAETPHYEGFEGGVALTVASLSVAANEWLVFVTRRAGKRLNSQSLLALARDNRSDALSSLLVIVGVVSSLFGAGWVEVGATAAIGVLITVMGSRSLREGLDVLMDRVPDLGLRARAQELVLGVEGVRGVQRLDVHPLGSEMRMDLEISVDGEISVRKGHAIAHEVGEAVTRGEPGVVEVAVHVNPAPHGTDSGTDSGSGICDGDGDPGSATSPGTV